MLNHYYFDNATLTCGNRKSEKVCINLDIDIQDDDPFATQVTKGHYHHGFACKGQLTIELPTSVPVYLKKMLEGGLVIHDQGDSTKLNIVLMDQLDSAVGIPAAIVGQPCRTKVYTWSFICVQKPISDGLGLFPEAVQRSIMKVFIFTHFPGFWNSYQTMAVVTAWSRQIAIEQLNDELEEKGLAPLREGEYSLLEVDPTKSSSKIVEDGSN